MTTEDGVARETAPAHLIDSRVLGSLFASAAMKEVFGDRAMVLSCVDAEVALVRAQADCGLVPAGAARAIAAGARSDDLDLEAIAAEIGRTSHPLVPVVRALAGRSGEAGAWVHYGATTQDIADTGLVLQARDGLDLIDRELSGLTGVLAGLAGRHRDLPMVGRTHGQHALLVQVDGRGAGNVRYRLLESVREYSLEQLEVRGEVEATRRSHALYFLHLAERAEPELIGREQRAWFLRLEAERGNLRAALRWFSSQGEYVPALRVAAALGYFWWIHGHFAEGRRHLEDLLERVPEGVADPRTRASALRSLGIGLLLQGEVGRARRALEEGLAAARSTGEARSIALSLACLGRYATLVGKPEEGMSFSEEALARSREANDTWGTARALHELGVAALHAGDYGRAQRLLEEGAGYRRVGDERSMAEAFVWLSPAVRQQGDAPRAAALVRQSLEVSQRLRAPRLFNMGTNTVLWLIGQEADPEQVTRLIGVVEALNRITGLAHSTWEHTPLVPAIGELGARLDEESLAAARREGHALSLDQMARMTIGALDEWSEATVHRGGPKEGAASGTLSGRESEVLGLVSEGLSNGEIAGRLFISERTVRFHLGSVFTKLGANNRTQAATLARQRNLL